MNDDIAYAEGLKDGRILALKEIGAYVREVTQLCAKMVATMQQTALATEHVVAPAKAVAAVTVVDLKLAKAKARVAPPVPPAVIIAVPQRKVRGPR